MPPAAPDASGDGEESLAAASLGWSVPSAGARPVPPAAPDTSGDGEESLAAASLGWSALLAGPRPGQVVRASS